MKKSSILIVEDEAIIGIELEEIFKELGYHVVANVNSGEKAIEKAEVENPDLILMDIRLKGQMDGIDAAEIIRNKFAIPVIFSTAYLDEERIQRAKITMPFGYVLKPIQERDLKVTIEMALYVSKIEGERKKKQEELLKSEDRLSTIYNSTSNYMCLLEVEQPGCFRFVSINEAYKKGIKLVNPEIPTDEIVGLRIEELGRLANWPDSVAELIIQSYNRAILTKAPVKIIDIIPAHIDNLYLESTYTPILDRNGECTHILFVCNDVTESKKNEDELRTLLKEKETLLQKFNDKL